MGQLNYTTADINAQLAKVANPDAMPTAASTALVPSGGIHSHVASVAAAAATAEVNALLAGADGTPTSASTNVVTSGGVHAAILAAGGLPPGFEEETLDMIEDDNTPGTRIFLTKEP